MTLSINDNYHTSIWCCVVQKVVFLNVMLNDIMLSVVMLSAVAPKKRACTVKLFVAVTNSVVSKVVCWTLSLPS